jgi:hypothetical protein
MITLCEMVSSFSPHFSRSRAAKTSTCVLTPLHLGDKTDDMTTMNSRGIFFQASAAAMIATLFPSTLVPTDNALALASCSSNVRNMERLASGDASGGSSYDNFPTSEGSKKRRAITGCKIPSARCQAASILGISSSFSERIATQKFYPATLT